MQDEIAKLNALVKRCDEDCLKYNVLVDQLERDKIKLEESNAFYRNQLDKVEREIGQKLEISTSPERYGVNMGKSSSKSKSQVKRLKKEIFDLKKECQYYKQKAQDAEEEILRLRSQLENYPTSDMGESYW